MVEQQREASKPDGPVPTFVISLARAGERRQRMCRHLDSFALSYELVDAVDGQLLSQSELNELVDPRSSLHPGAVGCYMSHVQVYRSMVERSISVALVLEDDARLSPEFLQVLHRGCMSVHWDYCFLDSEDHNDRGAIFYDRADAVRIMNGVAAYRLSAGPHTTHAYMITLEAARKRLAHAFPIMKPIDIYDHLPYSIVFRAVVAPKMAWVSEDSLVSFTSKKADVAESLSLRLLRRHTMFYRVRDLLRLKALRRSMTVARLVRTGYLSKPGRWVPLPSGREVIL